MQSKTNMKMMKHLILCSLLAAALPLGAQTLDECQKAAVENYPLIKRYGLIEQMTGLSVENVNKGWYPQITASAQATIQNRVVELPGALTDVMAQRGLDVKGLTKEQYRVGVDVNQLIYDGGRIKSHKEVERRQGDVDKGQNEVSLYEVRQRVNDLYFSILLVDDRLKQNEATLELLRSDEKKLQSMYGRGVASLYDLNSVKTERLKAEQQHTELQVQRRSLATVLSVFTGMETGELTMPKEIAVGNTGCARPELRLIDSQIALANAREKQLDASRLPVVSAFASGYYGYPGYNMYKDMFSRDWTLNGMVGIRVSWDLGWIWTSRNDRRKIALQRDEAENSRSTFLFNNRIEQIQQTDEMEKYKKMIAGDEEVMELRRQMRIAAESKLSHGIIAANDLVRDITNERDAAVTLSLHRIEYLKAIYDLMIIK